MTWAVGACRTNQKNSKLAMALLAIVGASHSVAHAQTLTVPVSLGNKTAAFDVGLLASENSFAPLGPNGFVAVGVDALGTGSEAATFNSTAYSSVDFNYNFTLGYTPTRSPYVDLTLSDTTGETFGAVTNFALYSVGSHGSLTIVPGVTWNQSTETLTGKIPLADAVAGDKFTIQLQLASGKNDAYFITGSVPVPGALVLFGSSLVAVGLLAVRNRRSTGRSIA